MWLVLLHTQTLPRPRLPHTSRFGVRAIITPCLLVAISTRIYRLAAFRIQLQHRASPTRCDVSLELRDECSAGCRIHCTPALIVRASTETSMHTIQKTRLQRHAHRRLNRCSTIGLLVIDAPFSECCYVGCRCALACKANLLTNVYIHDDDVILQRRS